MTNFRQQFSNLCHFPVLITQYNTHTHTPVDQMGYFLGINALPQELIEDIVSHTSPLDACGNLSIVSRRFLSAAISDNVWNKFLPADFISRLAVSNTLPDLPTRKDLYLFLSDNPSVIDGGAMYLWLDKPSGNRCYHIVSDKLSISEPETWATRTTDYGYIFGSEVPEMQAVRHLEVDGKISTSLLSPHTTYTAYLVIDYSRHFRGLHQQPLETTVGIDGGCEIDNRNVYIPYMYGLGPLGYKLRSAMPELTTSMYPQPRYQYYSSSSIYNIELGDYFNKEGGDNKELKMSLREVKSGIPKAGVSVLGIQILPKSCKNKIIEAEKQFFEEP